MGSVCGFGRSVICQVEHSDVYSRTQLHLYRVLSNFKRLCLTIYHTFRIVKIYIVPLVLEIIVVYSVPTKHFRYSKLQYFLITVGTENDF